ncbi:MAG TPA: hypothetical protein VNL18_10705 [Gemmatimonadales bacterium]|nr:hypothetical protein [Gemmatimonadales bacterium]
MMARLFKWLLLAALLCAAFVIYSYLGARITAGKVLGPNPPVSDRTIEFAFDGVPDLQGRPRAWVITYRASRLPGVRRVQIYVSPMGELIATRPADLSTRLDAWEKSRLP